jgi:hypothetical protein
MPGVVFGSLYRGSVRVERLFGRSKGPIFEVIPSVGVPSAVAAFVVWVTVDQVLFAKMKCNRIRIKT